MSTIAELFPRHLDLSSLRGQRRGLVRCIFHQDRTPSLSIDLDAGVFHCFGCGVAGGWQRFAQLVGDEREPAAGPRGERVEPLRDARRRVVAEERHHQEKRDALRPLMLASDAYRTGMREVDEARARATRLGPSDRAWDVLHSAAAVETDLLRRLAAADGRA